MTPQRQAFQRACSARYGVWWWSLTERERDHVVLAVFEALPELVTYVQTGQGSATAWLHADDFVELLACAPRMTGFASNAEA